MAIVKVTYGGTAISSWQKGASAGFFSVMQGRVAAAQAELLNMGFADVNVDAFFWQQGESDSSASNAANYQTRLQTLINDFRSTIGTSNTKVVIGGVLNSIANSSLINGAGQTIADSNSSPTIDSNPTVSWFATNDLPLANTSDGIHFNYNGALEMGNRFAANYKQMTVPEPGTYGAVIFVLVVLGICSNKCQKQYKFLEQQLRPCQYDTGTEMHVESFKLREKTW
jgi:hypothetical protein